MAVDDSSSTGKKAVSAVLELIALALGLGAEEAWRAGKSWHQWVPEGTAGLLCQVGVFTWLQAWALIQKGNPWQQAKEARLRIQKLSKLIPQTSKLNIHSASWGSASSRQPVLEAVNRQPKDGLVLGVSNEVLGCDPAWGDNNKYIEVEYSYGDGPMRKASRKQGRLLVLPEDKQFIEDTAAECERKRTVDVSTLETRLQEKDREAASNLEEIGRYMRELNRLEDEKAKHNRDVDDLTEKLQRQTELANHYSTQIASWGEADAAATRLHREEMSALTAKLELTKPVVVPVSFGQQDKPERKAQWLGLILSNDGKETAYEIEVIPFTIGMWRVSFEGLPRLHINEKTPSWIDVRHDNVGDSDLRRHIINWQTVNGGLGSPVPFGIKYRDSLNNWFVSSCEFRFNVITTSGLDVHFIRRELFVP